MTARMRKIEADHADVIRCESAQQLRLHVAHNFHQFLFELKQALVQASFEPLLEGF